MWEDSHQALLTKLVQESLIKICSENLPSFGSSIDIDALVCLTSGKAPNHQLIIKIHKVLQPNNNTEHCSSNKNQSWAVANYSKSGIENHRLDPNEPVDLTGTKSQNISKGVINLAKQNGAKGKGFFNITNGIQETDHNGAIFRGPIPVPRVEETCTENSSNRYVQLQPPIYKPVHLKPGTSLDEDTNESFQDLGPDDDKSSKTLECRICSLICCGGFASLQAHIQQVHRRYVCRYCYNTFSLRCNLKRHERLHGGVKPYNCKVCGKTFARSTDLKIHMQKHGLSGSDVVVPCPKCPRSFLSVQSLRWHLHKVHKELEATYACSICEKLFLDKEEFVKHQDDHMNCMDSRPPSSATVDSQDMDGMADDYLDSDNDNLCIDIQSEEGTMDSDMGLPGSQVNDLGGSINKSITTGSEKNNNHSLDDVSKSREGPDGTNIVTGSRKRRKGNPIKHVEIQDEDIDIDDMYYNSPLVKQKQHDKLRETMDDSLDYDNEPQDLVMRKTDENVPDLISVSSTPHASATIRMIAENVASMSSTGNYLGNSWDSNGFKQLKMSNSSQSSFSYPGNKTPEPAKTSESYSPLTLPILITPDSHKYRQSPNYNKFSLKTEASSPLTDDPNREFQCAEFSCTEINETFIGFSAYEDHCMLRHGRYPCKYCKQTFSGKNNRTRHMRCHVGAKVYTCPDCFKNFSRPDSMREHQFIHTLSYQEDKCRNCGLAFEKKNLLLAHLKQCYRHKMETGKSTKLIDETPTYLKNTQENGSQQQDVELKPLLPFKFENIPGFPKFDSAFSSPAGGTKAIPTLPYLPQSLSPALLAFANRASPVMFSSKSNIEGPTQLKPIVIAPTIMENGLTEASVKSTNNKHQSPVPSPANALPLTLNSYSMESIADSSAPILARDSTATLKDTKNGNLPIQDYSFRNSPVENLSNKHRNSPVQDLSTRLRNSPVEDLSTRHRNSPVLDSSDQQKNSAVTDEPVKDISVAAVNVSVKHVTSASVTGTSSETDDSVSETIAPFEPLQPYKDTVASILSGHGKTGPNSPTTDQNANKTQNMQTTG